MEESASETRLLGLSDRAPGLLSTVTPMERAERRLLLKIGSPHLRSYVCANIVCSPEGIATAVLLRAGEVVDGLDLARERRTTSKRDSDLAQGPARLCVALGITLDDDGDDLATGAITLEPAPHPVSAFETGPRTGVSGEGGTDAYPWRYWIADDPTVSAYRASAPRKHP
jgi:DNA-3-methyladenine glycosylase